MVTAPVSPTFDLAVSPDVPSPARTQNERVPELDGIRGVAILLVVVWHYVALPFSPPPGSVLALFWPLLALTWSGVDLFFVLSGFLIGGILIEQRESPNYFQTFYVRRICRIMPLYYLLLLGTWIGIHAGLAQQSAAWKWLFANPLPFWSYVVFGQNSFMLQDGDFGANALAVTWSLAVEEQFYLIFPWLVRYVPKARLVHSFLAIIVLAPLCRILFSLFHSVPSSGAFFFMPSHLDALGLGALAAYAIRSEVLMGQLRKHCKALYVLFAFLVAGCVIMCFVNPGVNNAPMALWGHSWLALCFVLLTILPIVHKEGPLAGILRTGWLRNLGIISYGVYLLHPVVIGVVDALFFHGRWHSGLAMHILFVCTATVATISAAAILYRFLESPILRWGRRFRY